MMARVRYIRTRIRTKYATLNSMCQVGPVKPTEEWSHTRLRPPACAALQPLCAPGLTPAEQPLLSSSRALLLATAAMTARRPQDPRRYQWSRGASPPAAQPLVVPPWCATGRRGSSEAAALHAPAGGGAAFSRSLCSGFPAFIGGRRCCRFQSSCRAAAPVGALSGRRRPGEAGGGSLHLVHTLHSVAYLYTTSIFHYYRKSYGRVIVFIDTFKDEQVC